jgi:hypothetical protein
VAERRDDDNDGDNRDDRDDGDGGDDLLDTGWRLYAASEWRPKPIGLF